MVYRTTDSGFTWTEQGAIAKVSLFGLSFPDGTQGWASGENGTIVHLDHWPLTVGPILSHRVLIGEC